MTARQQRSGRTRKPAPATSLLARLVAWDEQLSQRCHVRGWGYEMLFKVLEWSGHGVPWLVFAAFLVAATHPDATEPDSKLASWLAHVPHIKPGSVLGPLWDAAKVPLMTREALHQAAWQFCFALFLDLALVGTVKVAVRRRRPSYNKNDMMVTVPVDAFSFPSGHTTRTTTMALLLPALYPFTPLGVAVLVLWSILVAASRVTLGRHHVLDVLCGLILGVIDVWLVHLLFPHALAYVVSLLHV